MDINTGQLSAKLLSLYKDLVERVMLLTVISFLPESRIAGESHPMYQCLGETVPSNDHDNEKDNVVLLEESPSCDVRERAFHTLQWEQLNTLRRQ